MQKLFIHENGDQELLDLTPDEIAELAQISVIPKPPRAIDARRLKLALLELGRLAPLEAAIDSAGAAALIQWQNTTIFSEDHELVQSLIVGLGWTPAIVDEIFETAGAIS